MTKLFAVPMILYVKAMDEKLASGVAELKAFAGTTALRMEGSGWVSDETTTIVTNGRPIEVTSIPEECYNKDILVEVYGEDAAIRFLNKIHQ